MLLGEINFQKHNTDLCFERHCLTVTDIFFLLFLYSFYTYRVLCRMHNLNSYKQTPILGPCVTRRHKLAKLIT